MNRRQFLALGAGACIFQNDLLATTTSKNKSVVMLFLGGGASHIETWNPIPDAPVEYRSAVGAIDTNVSGIQIGGLWQNVAKHADKGTFVRSFAHTNAGHSGGTHWLITGKNNTSSDNGGVPNHPSVGSVVAKFHGINSLTGIPNYIKTSGIYADGAGWLGSQYAPFDVSGQAKRNMEVRIDAKKNLIESFDSFQKEWDRSGSAGAFDVFRDQALDLIGSSVKEAFDISKEGVNGEKYGNTQIGKNMLLAKRLVSSGTRFVTVQHGGWDMHSDISKGFNRLLPEVDVAVAAFVQDIYQAGLGEDVLLVVTGEFGRTPKINKNAGRDHWPGLSALAMFGGSNTGRIVGSSNDKGEYPKSGKVGPENLTATIFNHLEIPLNLHYIDQSGRPIQMSDATPI